MSKAVEGSVVEGTQRAWMFGKSLTWQGDYAPVDSDDEQLEMSEGREEL